MVQTNDVSLVLTHLECKSLYKKFKSKIRFRVNEKNITFWWQKKSLGSLEKIYLVVFLQIKMIFQLKSGKRNDFLTKNCYYNNKSLIYVENMKNLKTLFFVTKYFLLIFFSVFYQMIIIFQIEIDIIRIFI